MQQLTLRVPEELARELKAAATREGRSVNALATHVLRTAVDPDYAADGTEALRERLRRAGLLMEWDEGAPARVPRTELEAARRRAAQGKPLSDYVSEGRR